MAPMLSDNFCKGTIALEFWNHLSDKLSSWFERDETGQEDEIGRGGGAGTT
jgi:hypothetical protein